MIGFWTSFRTKGWKKVLLCQSIRVSATIAEERGDGEGDCIEELDGFGPEKSGVDSWWEG